jgi:Co/Zn/Cd efflux system component
MAIEVVIGVIAQSLALISDTYGLKRSKAA